MDQNQKNHLAKLLGLSPETQKALDAGSDHPFDCRCEKCREWWKLMGPEPGTENYGPFSPEEINPAPGLRTDQLKPATKDAALRAREELRLLFNDIKALYTGKMTPETIADGVALTIEEHGLLSEWLNLGACLVDALNREVR